MKVWVKKIEVERGVDLPVVRFIDVVLKQILEYLYGDTTVERGGFLLGRVLPGEICIDAFWEARYTIATGSSLQFTALTWNDYDDRKKASEGDLQLLGWVHSHPDLGVFLSHRDQTVNLFFPYFALVVDPVRQEMGLYYLKTTPELLFAFNILGEGDMGLDFENYKKKDEYQVTKNEQKGHHE